VRLTAETRTGSIARTDAQRDERRARWAYEDESWAQHDQHGLAETHQHRLQRASRRLDVLRRDAVDRGDRPARMADEAEFTRELGE
jgi:hypothetical protein